jgi:hypothetical protein
MESSIDWCRLCLQNNADVIGGCKKIMRRMVEWIEQYKNHQDTCTNESVYVNPFTE